MENATAATLSEWVTSEISANNGGLSSFVTAWPNSSLSWTSDSLESDPIERHDNESTAQYEESFGLLNKPTWYLALITTIYGILIVITLVGNIFVVVAYHVDIRIRRYVANTFILNLAISDLIVGAFTLPIYFVWNLIGEWVLGEYLCKFWSFVDFTVTTMSVITIILISLDRYWLLSKKTAYSSYQTRFRVNLTVALCWIVVSSAFMVLIFGWAAVLQDYPVDFDVHCDSEFIYNFPALMCYVVVFFAVPAVIIIVLNVIVYYKIRARAKGINELDNRIRRSESDARITREERPLPLKSCFKTKEPTIPGGNGDINGLDSGVILVSISKKPMAVEQQCEIAPSPWGGVTSGIGNADSDNDYSARNDEHKNSETSNNGNGNQEVFSISDTVANEQSGPTTSGKSKLDVLINKLKRSQHEFRREKRAALVLAVIVTVFILCWMPIYITVIVGIACEYVCIPPTVFIVVENLVWANSALNPMLYAATNVHFRRNFLRFLGCKRLARRLERPISLT